MASQFDLFETEEDALAYALECSLKSLTNGTDVNLSGALHQFQEQDKIFYQNAFQKNVNDANDVKKSQIAGLACGMSIPHWMCVIWKYTVPCSCGKCVSKQNFFHVCKYLPPEHYSILPKLYLSFGKHNFSQFYNLFLKDHFKFCGYEKEHLDLISVSKYKEYQKSDSHYPLTFKKSGKMETVYLHESKLGKKNLKARKICKAVGISFYKHRKKLIFCGVLC